MLVLFMAIAMLKKHLACSLASAAVFGLVGSNPSMAQPVATNCMKVPNATICRASRGYSVYNQFGENISWGKCGGSWGGLGRVTEPEGCYWYAAACGVGSANAIGCRYYSHPVD